MTQRSLTAKRIVTQRSQNETNTYISHGQRIIHVRGQSLDYEIIKFISRMKYHRIIYDSAESDWAKIVTQWGLSFKKKI